MRALSVPEINEIVEDFAQAIRRVKEAGWDGAELHGAHAYFLSTFLSPYTNRRTDDYGGSVRNRVRIVADIVQRAKTLAGDDFPVLSKVNSDDSGGGHGEITDGINPDNFGELAAELERCGLDAIEASGNGCLNSDVDEPEEQSYFLPNLVNVDVGIPIILTGGNRSVDLLREIMQGSQANFLGLSRPLVREPGLPLRWETGEGTPEAACISCNQCFTYMISGLRCHQEA
jgi:2,4-dienoyl-CoA reductase-like NADH-dependent reductase (Old Yellow Enzyme family)